jgi:hypothetical protein
LRHEFVDSAALMLSCIAESFDSDIEPDAISKFEAIRNGACGGGDSHRYAFNRMAFDA